MRLVRLIFGIMFCCVTPYSRPPRHQSNDRGLTIECKDSTNFIYSFAQFQLPRLCCQFHLWAMQEEELNEQIFKLLIHPNLI